MRLIRAKILNHRELVPDYYQMTLEAPEIAQEAKPGQFIHVRVSEGFDPLLRRPLSIHRVRGQRVEDKGQIEILYKVVGKGTELLSKKEPGEKLDVLGPLGNGFKIGEKGEGRRDERVLLIAGGIGVAPLMFLCEELLIPHPSSLITILLGAKTKEEILCEKDFKELGTEVKVATDDGSYGHKGPITDLLPTASYLLPTIYACGPTPMLKEVARFAKEHNLPTQISLGSHMACGVGACLGCARKIKAKGQDSERFIQICIKGPVFEADEVVWDE